MIASTPHLPLCWYETGHCHYAILEILLLGDDIITEGEMVCFDALLSIYLAGEGEHFLVLPGGKVTLIAGENIVMLPGTHVQQGGFLHAFISPGGPFCSEPESQFFAIDKHSDNDPKAYEIISAFNDSEKPDLLFRVYPNPAKNQFTLELINYDNSSGVFAEVYDMHGRLVKRTEMLSGQQQYLFSLEEHNPGVFLVRVVHGAQTGSERLIKQ